ncbi:MAG: alpha/beta hydrolase [Solirubrobacterales bacterium]
MKSELCSVLTEDGVTLHGALFEGDPERPAMILLPGAAMNFYTGMGGFLPEILASNGYTCFSANHRGHDFGSAPDGDKKPVIGLIRDRFIDCVHDVAGLVRFLEERGYRKIILAAHSQSVPKILYAMNALKLPAAEGAVLLSPPPSFDRMLRYLVGDSPYERLLAKAKELAELGVYDQLSIVKGRNTMPWILSTGMVLDYYSPDTPADVVKLAANAHYPMLVVRGERDFDPVSPELMRSIQANAALPGACSLVEIAGADHFYNGREAALGQAVLDWLGRLEG